MRAAFVLAALGSHVSACSVGDSVACPDGKSNCMGNQCCQDGSTCPSASPTFHSCPKPKTTDCTGGGSPGLFRGRCGIAVTETEAAEIAANQWLNEYGSSIGFWYNWADKSSIQITASGVHVPFLPMWWGSQSWHTPANSWCSNAGHTPIPAESGETSLAFAWNEPLGGSACQYSMGACAGGNYGGLDGAARAAKNYAGCVSGAKEANRLVSTPCLNNLEPDWFRAFAKNRPASDIKGQSKTVCCSHIYASLYNGAAWGSCDMNAMTNLDKLPGQLQGLVNDGTCDYHFIQEIGIGGCQSADQTASERLIQNLGNAVRNIPSVYLGWFANSEGDGGTSRRTTWLFEENAGTVGKAYKDMCMSLQTSQTLANATTIVV